MYFSIFKLEERDSLVNALGKKPSIGLEYTDCTARCLLSVCVSVCDKLINESTNWNIFTNYTLLEEAGENLK